MKLSMSTLARAQSSIVRSVFIGKMESIRAVALGLAMLFVYAPASALTGPQGTSSKGVVLDTPNASFSASANAKSSGISSALNTPSHEFHTVAFNGNTSEGVNAGANGTNHATYEDGLSIGANQSHSNNAHRVKAAEIVTATASGSPVPEPTTWAMLIVGLGLVTLRIRGMSDRSSKIH